MHAHAEDLRAEVTDHALVEALLQDPASAPVQEPNRRLIDYTLKLTRTPSRVGQADVDLLRKAGFSDPAIHDAAQAISYFNYINRIAEGLGVDLEEEMPLPPGDEPPPAS